MDIVKRAYLNVLERVSSPGDFILFHELVKGEIIRLIGTHAYERRVWPTEFGPLPDELKPKIRGGARL